MSASAHARRERTELAELMLVVGPDAPTLCEGWTTRDLAAHLVARESRPDAALGLVVGPLADWTARVQAGIADQPYPDLVRKVRTGPPTLSVFSLPGVDAQANLVEFVVHHEDVLRAQPGWLPRTLPADLADELWARLARTSRLLYRRAPVGVTLVRTDGPGAPITAKGGDPVVTLTGTAIDLLLSSFGRRAVAVDIVGTAEAVAALESTPLSL